MLWEASPLSLCLLLVSQTGDIRPSLAPYKPDGPRKVTLMPFSNCTVGNWYVVFTCVSCGTRQPLCPDSSEGEDELNSTIARCAFCGRSRFYQATQFERVKHTPSGDLDKFAARL